MTLTEEEALKGFFKRNDVNGVHIQEETVTLETRSGMELSFNLTGVVTLIDIDRRLEDEFAVITNVEDRSLTAPY